LGKINIRSLTAMPLNIDCSI